MKKLMVGVLSVFAINAGAQTISAPLETEAPAVKQAKGIRVTAIKPMLEQRVSQFFPGQGGTTKNTTGANDESFGVGIGFGDIAVRDIGYTLNLAYIDLGSEETQKKLDGIARIDANLTYGFNEKLNIHGGANATKYTQGTVGRQLRPGTGAQAGIGYQISKNLGVDAGYTFMTFGGNNKGGTRDVTTSGAEVAVTGTF